MDLPHTVWCTFKINLNPVRRPDSEKTIVSVAVAASLCGLVNQPSAASELNTETCS